MFEYINTVDSIWQEYDNLSSSLNTSNYNNAKDKINEIIQMLDQGIIRVAYKDQNTWQVNSWIKKAILLYFRFNNSRILDNNLMFWYDKIPLKYNNLNTNQLLENNIRAVPGSIVRYGAYIANNVVLMPSFINIGAYIGLGTMIDTWVTIGSCAQIGQNCHISGGAGIGGVLEPLSANPVIIEDNCFIGARSEIAEGVIVGQGSVVGMGVFIGASTKIINRTTGEVTYGYIPPYSVVVAGSMPNADISKPNVYCAVIVKKVDESTRSKTKINDILRDS